VWEHAIEGKIDERIKVMERRGRRNKGLLDVLKEKRRFWKLKGEALNRPLWGIHF
jgi:hypothetical protein